MLKKLAFLFCLPLLVSGCNTSHQIETAAVIETVTVDSQNGQLCYTFYPLSDSDAPEGVRVPADSFEQARCLAEERYIPHLSLAKLELLLLHENVDRQTMRSDIFYISTQASFSPVAYIALCDSNTLKKIGENTSAQTTVEQQILLCKQQRPEVKIDYLSVFNSYAAGNKKGFDVPYITADKELKVSTVSIYA